MHEATYAGRRVLITGGLGFIGSNLAIRLVELGADVTVLDSMIPEFGATLFSVDPVRDEIEIDRTDLRDAEGLERALAGQDFVFNLAGQLSHIDSMRDPLTDLDINCRAQLSLLEGCRRTSPDARIVFTSTRQVYGKPRYLPVDEDHPVRPVDVNGVTKSAAESFFRLYSEVHGVSSVSLRLTNTYGPRMDLRSDTKGFVGIFVRKALRGEEIQVFGSGDQKRDFNYVDDVVEALLLAAANRAIEGDELNLGHPEPTSLNDFLSVLGELADFTVTRAEWPDDRKKIDVGDYYGDFARFHALTGWKPGTPLREGLSATVDFYRDFGEHYL